MESLEASSIISKVISIAVLVIPFAILPFNAIDPINTPQLTILSIVAFILLGILITSRHQIHWSKHRMIFALLCLFLADLFLVFIFSKANLQLQFFGTFGRNTGLLTYSLLSIVLFSSVLISNDDNLEKIKNNLIKVGIIATAYGIIQYFGLDPVPWDNIFSPVIGFLGNPNFQSALLGICGVLVFTSIFVVKRQIRKSAMFLILFILIVFTIYQTDSRQGLLNLMAGIVVVTWIYLKEKGNRLLTGITTALILISGSLVCLGIFNIGPLGELLYKRSISARVFYWEAGIKMTLQNPVWGVGLDNYGDWYRRVRTNQAATTFGPDSVSDVAHNVLIDFSSNGGILLLTFYSALIVLTIVSIIRVIRRQKKFNLSHSAMVGAWVSYQAQSLVSINQITLVFIGWTLSGLLIGYDLSNNDFKAAPQRKITRKNHASLASPKYVLVIFLFGFIGFIVGSSPMVSSIKYRAALESGDINRIKNAAELFPLEPLRVYQVASVLRDNKYEKESIEVIGEGLKNFPNSFILWRFMSQVPEIPEAQLSEIKKKLRYLDPHNPNV